MQTKMKQKKKVKKLWEPFSANGKIILIVIFSKAILWVKTKHYLFVEENAFPKEVSLCQKPLVYEINALYM